MGFSITNDVAYTEDNVLVYNIMVFNIPKQTANCRIWKYFQRFGTVLDVRVLPYPQRYHKCMGVLVYYNEPRSAAKALRTSHRFDRRYMRVLAARTWHQPGGKNPWTELASTDQELTILKLNDYCIAKVFSYLNADEQVNLARNDPRLKALFSLNARKQYKKLRLKTINVLSVWETLLFFKMAGCYVQKITGLAPPTEVLKFIGIHCPNLKYLKFAQYELFDWPCDLTRHGLHLLLRNTRLLTHVELDNSSLQDNCILVLVKLKNLKVLSLANNGDLSGKYMAAMKHLEILTLNNCGQIRSQYFQELCEKVTSLKSLDIENCSLLMPYDMRIMVNNLCDLETLKLSADIVEMKILAKLKNLRSLHLHSNGLVPMSVIGDLVLHLGQQLELFELKGIHYNTLALISHISKLSKLQALRCPSWRDIDDLCLEMLSNLSGLRELSLQHCSRYSAESLIKLISKCSYLGTLNVVGCSQLTQQFFKDIVSLFASEREQGNHLRQTKVTTSNYHYADYALDKLSYEGDGKSAERIFESQWD